MDSSPDSVWSQTLDQGGEWETHLKHFSDLESFVKGIVIYYHGRRVLITYFINFDTVNRVGDRNYSIVIHLSPLLCFLKSSFYFSVLSTPHF